MVSLLEAKMKIFVEWRWQNGVIFEKAIKITAITAIKIILNYVRQY